MAVGCYHGLYHCPTARSLVLEFSRRYKPHTRIDLGDVHDMTAFRSGAKGTKDETANIELDYNCGVEWLTDYRPTLRCAGNHDFRVDKLANHHNAIISHAATTVLMQLRAVDEKLKTRVIPYGLRSYFELGDCKFLHGVVFNEAAIRDHAEMYGKCVIAHLHTPGTARGRSLHNPPAWCVGTMGDPDKFEYAQTRRSTMRWAHGLVFGEYSDDHCEVNLIQWDCKHGQPEMVRFPI